ncbi:MAG: amidohydrolase family protein [Bacteroidia bacterium]|nr:amidohydrolase family protein [Bacteroidia bacterium]
MKRIVIASLILLGAVSLAGQMPKARTGVFALTNATLETVSQGTQKGTLLIRDGKIAALGANVVVPDGAEVIDCTGKTIYPGMIDGGSRVGLQEISAVDVTVDYAEIGDVVPHMQALTAVNPNSVQIPVTRVAGVTTVLAVPQGGVFPGTAALIHLFGYTPDQMYAGFSGVVMNFPSTALSGRFRNMSEEEQKKETEKRLKKLNETWEKAIAYARIDSMHQAGKGAAPAYYPEMQALMPVVRGTATLLIEVNTAEDILSAIQWVKDRRVKAVFTGVAEGWRVADKLAAANIPVITGPMLAMPTRDNDRYDRPYANPGLMQKAGVTVALRTNGAENTRNLPFNAGFAAAYGMGREQALRAVTLVPAQILGVADQLGSLEVGKRATLFVADGDPFETRTQIIQVFIDGYQIPMETRQTQLYDEFLERTPGVKK